MRIYIHFPVLHDIQADHRILLPDTPRNRQIEEDLIGLHKEFWQQIERDAARYAPAKLYQDNMMYNPSVLQKIDLDRKAESYNVQTLERLMQQGAVLQKTEHVSLEILTDISKNAEKLGKKPRVTNAIHKVMTSFRDRSIVYHINKSLNDREVGVGFIGSSHDVCEQLRQKGICVIHEERALQKFGKKIELCTLQFLAAHTGNEMITYAWYNQQRSNI